MRKKIMVAGYLCLDMTPHQDSANLHSEEIKELFVPGKIIPVSSVTMGCGGAVANTGLALKKFGADVALVGGIGKDAFGKFISEYFEKYDAAGDLLVRDDLSTSFSIVIVPPRDDRFFLVNAGSNDVFNTGFLNDGLLKECSVFHFGYPTIMKKMYGDEGKELIAMYKKVHDLGIVTSMDTAMSDPASEAMKCDWKDIFRRLFPYLDIFTPSVEELCLMTDPELYAEWVKRANGRDMTQVLSLEKDILPLADRIISLGAGVLMLKCGLPGILLRTGPSERISGIPGLSSGWENLTIFEKSFKPDRVLSGLGAGDCSIAAFLKSIYDGKSPQDCLKLAAAAGADNVTAYDSLSGLKPLSDCEARIRRGWKKYDE